MARSWAEAWGSSWGMSWGQAGSGGPYEPDTWGTSWRETWGASWRRGGVTRDRGDYGPSRSDRKKRPKAYEDQKKLYFRQLQDELDRQLEAREPEPEQQAPRKARRIVTEAIPPPVLTEPPMIAGEASRLIQAFLAEHTAMRRAAMKRELMRIAEEMARQQDEEDALAVLMAVL